MLTFIIVVIILVLIFGGASSSSNPSPNQNPPHFSQKKSASTQSKVSASKENGTGTKVSKAVKECPKCKTRNLVENLSSSSTCNSCNWRLFEKYNPNTVTTPITNQKVLKTVKECPKCKTRNLVENLNSSSTCNKCKWILFQSYHSKETDLTKLKTKSATLESTKSTPEKKLNKDNTITVKLTGVTYEGRQGIISKMRASDKIFMKRDKFNKHDENAIGVYNSQNQNVGWIPREKAAAIAPSIDAGIKYDTKIHKILGGNGYNYGLEVIIKEHGNTIKSHQAQKANSQLNKTASQNKYEGVAKNILEKPEYMYIDTVLTRLADQESLKEVYDVLADFIKFRDKALPYLNRQNIEHLVMADLESLFDNTIMLAAGTESNFIHKHYKAILIQLAFQLGFLNQRLLPGSSYAKYAQSKMNWLSTMDVRLENKILQPFFNENVKVIRDAPVIADTTVSDQIPFWDIDEIAYVLSNLTDLGCDFKKFIEEY